MKKYMLNDRRNSYQYNVAVYSLNRTYMIDNSILLLKYDCDKKLEKIVRTKTYSYDFDL